MSPWIPLSGTADNPVVQAEMSKFCTSFQTQNKLQTQQHWESWNRTMPVQFLQGCHVFPAFLGLCGLERSLFSELPSWQWEPELGVAASATICIHLFRLFMFCGSFGSLLGFFWVMQVVRNDNNNTVNPLISQPARRVILGSRASPAPPFPCAPPKMHQWVCVRKPK